MSSPWTELQKPSQAELEKGFFWGLGMIILCLEKVNILFPQPAREWVAIPMHFLEAGIQRVQMERSFWIIIFPPLGC